MGSARRGGLWFGALLMALHAQVLIHIRNVDREPELAGDRLPIAAHRETMGIVAHGAGDAKIVLRSGQAFLDIIGGDSPGSQYIASFVAGAAAGRDVVYESAILLLQRHGVT